MKKSIEISVKNRVAWQTNTNVYICGNGDFEVVFAFDPEWDRYETKTARFVHDGENTDVVFNGNKCTIPKTINATRLEVGVYAGELYATTPAAVRCVRSILCNNGAPADPPPDVYAQIMEMLKIGPSNLRIGFVELLANKWEGEESPFSQVVEIPGVTENSQIDLTPSVEQLTVFYDKDLTFVTENEGGVVTVYAIGQKPANDYTIQITIKEVST